MIAYRKDKLAPTLMIACVGGATLATMIWMVGIDILRQWYFYPSITFWIFSLLCITTGISRSWDRTAWKICQWWSGMWSVAFLLFFCAPPFSCMIVGSLFAPIAASGGVNPFLAAFAHIMIWACVTDILKTSIPTNLIEEAQQDVHGNTH
jgi:hypothetical protein